MRRLFSWILGTLTWLVSAVVLWATLLQVNLPTICGMGPAPWWHSVERLAFAPTIWVTMPLDQALSLHGLGWAVTVVSVLETLLLATLYAWLVLHFVRGDLGDRLGRIWQRRRRWVVGALTAAVLLSAGARAERWRLDFRREVRVVQASPTIQEINSLAGGSIEVVESHVVPNPPLLSQLIAVPRGAAPPWVLAAGALTEEAGEGAQLQLFELAGDALLPRQRFELGGQSHFGVQVEPRYAWPAEDGAVVALPGEYGGLINLLGPLGSSAKLSGLTLHLDSEVPLRSPGRLFLAGLVFSGEEVDSAVAHLRTIQRPVRAGHSIAIFEVDPATKAVTQLGTAGPFGDHSGGNVDSVVTEDGVIHLLGVEVLVGNENSSRIHHLRFDPAARKWEGDDVLQVRSSFTSVGNPRLLRYRFEGKERVAGFWSLSGGAQTYADDGFYAHQVGESAVVRLASESGAFAVLPLDGVRGELLAALNRERGDALEWFLRRSGSWRKLGVTKIPSDTYMVTMGSSDPFAIWIEGERVRAAFHHKDGLLLQEMSWSVEGEGASIASGLSDFAGEAPSFAPSGSHARSDPPGGDATKVLDQE